MIQIDGKLVQKDEEAQGMHFAGLRPSNAKKMIQIDWKLVQKDEEEEEEEIYMTKNTYAFM